VVLYKLLSGALPFDSQELRQAGFAEMQRIILEKEPKTPSTRVSTSGESSGETARERGTDIQTLRRRLRGDLDWITMKALAKDRGRRYGTPLELVADLERYLASEPVLARSPSTAYRFHRFVKRHRQAALAVLAVLIALVGGLAATTAMYFQARENAYQAKQQERIARQTNDFLDGMFSSITPEKAQGRKGVTVKWVLDQAVQKIEKQPTSNLEVEQSIRSTIGKTYLKLGCYKEALLHLKRALEISLQVFGEDHLVTVNAKDWLSILYFKWKKYRLAEPLIHWVLEKRRQLLGKEHPQILKSMNSLASILVGLQKFGEGEKLFLAILKIKGRIHKEGSLEIINTMIGLGALYFNQNKLVEARRLFRKILELQKEGGREKHPTTISAMHNLAIVLLRLRKWDEAETLMRRTGELSRKVRGPEHPETLGTISNLANFLYDRKKYSQAENLYQEVLVHQQRVLGEKSSDTLNTMSMLASTLMAQEKFDPAETIHRKVLSASHDSSLGDFRIGVYEFRLGSCLRWQKKFSHAEEFLLASYRHFKLCLKEGHPRRQQSLAHLVDTYKNLGRKDKAKEFHALLKREMGIAKKGAHAKKK